MATVTILHLITLSKKRKTVIDNKTAYNESTHAVDTTTYNESTHVIDKTAYNESSHVVDKTTYNESTHGGMKIRTGSMGLVW